MDVLQLRYLLAVVEAGSLSRAATVLRVSQPALSQRMNQLEREVGTRLLERGPRGVRPTSAGEDFCRDAQRVVRQFDRLADAATSGPGVRGLVSVGLPSGAAQHLAAPLWTWVADHHPGVRLELFESMSGYIEELFARGRMDLAVAYVDAPGPAGRSVGQQGRAAPSEPVLYAEELCLVGEPPTPPTHGDRIAVADLDGVPLVAPGLRSSLRGLLERTLAEHRVRPTVVADVESLTTMLRIAAGGRACAVLPRSATAADPSLPVRRLDPPLLRHAVVRTAPTPSAPADTLAAVRSGVVAVTRELAGSGAWPGIDPAPQGRPSR